MSEIAALITDMVKAGVDPELIGRTAEALSHRDAVLVPDEAAERRRAADRERKRLRNSVEVGGTSGTTVPPKEVPPAPLQEITPSNPSTHKETPLRGSKKGSRLPSDFALPAEWRDWAIERGLPAHRVQVEFEKLTNWAANAGAKGAKSNWFRAWQNWIIEAIDKLPSARAGPSGVRPNLLVAALGSMETPQNDDIAPQVEGVVRYLPAAGRG